MPIRLGFIQSQGVTREPSQMKLSIDIKGPKAVSGDFPLIITCQLWTGFLREARHLGSAPRCRRSGEPQRSVTTGRLLVAAFHVTGY